MRSDDFTTLNSRSHIAARLVLAAGVLISFSVAAFAQRIAIIAPEGNAYERAYIADFSRHLTSPVKILDPGMSETAFRSAAIASPFNMSTADARTVVAVTGCEYLLLVRAGEQRRASFSRPEYYEAFAFLFLIDGRTGELVSWRRSSFDAGSQVDASRALAESISATAAAVLTSMSQHRLAERPPVTSIEEVPEEGSPANTGLKPPIPYRRIKPGYTETAFLYDIRATIDIEADIGADGTVLGVRFRRWAGFGLEESVEKAVRQMNWRPAMRNGKPLPMRILLRYNFTKVDKE